MTDNTQTFDAGPSPERLQATPIPRWHHALALAGLTLLWVLFFWRILTPIAGDRLIFAEGDFTVQFFSNSDYQVARINQGQLVPGWNPYNYAGEPFAANLQVAAWYPPRWVAGVLLGDETGWQVEDFQLEVAAHYWLVAITLYAFLILRLGRVIPSLSGALLFTYGGYLASYPMLQVSILESAAWLPLMLIGLHLSLTRPRWGMGGVVLAGIAAAFSFFAGHPQTTMQAVYLSVAYLAFMGHQRRVPWRGIGWRLVVYGAVCLGIALVQLWPSVEFTGLSFRVDQYSYADKASGFALAELVHIFWPNPTGAWSPLYISIAGILLAGGALLRPDRENRFWGASALVALLLSLGQNSIVYDFFYVFVPGISVFRLQEHMAYIFSFSVVMLAARQLHWLLYAEQQRPAERARFVWWVGAFLAINGAVLLVAALYSTAQSGMLIFVVIMAGLFAYWLAGKKTTFTALLLVILLVIDLFTITTRMGNWVADTPENRPTPPVELARLQVPNVQDIQWRVDGSAGVGSYGIYWRIPDIYGIGPIFLEFVEQLRQLPVHRFWEVLGARYITLADVVPLEAADNLELLAYGQNAGGQEYQLLAVRDPRPLAHLVYDSIMAQGSAAFARQFMADPAVDLRETAIVLHPLAVALPGTRPDVAEVRDFRMETPERVTMTVSTETDALLTIAIPDYPGWEATLNGREAEIVDVYAGLIGVPIPAGVDQQVVLTFTTPTMRLGAIISGLTLALSLLAALAVAFRVGRHRA